jgi:hypothetical protein
MRRLTSPQFLNDSLLQLQTGQVIRFSIAYHASLQAVRPHQSSALVLAAVEGLELLHSSVHLHVHHR